MLLLCYTLLQQDKRRAHYKNERMVNIMTTVKNTTKQAQSIIRTFNSGWNKGKTIWDAYGKPSDAKVRAYEAILDRAVHTEGYNGDFIISGASSCFFSTMYSYTDAEGTHIVYDTPSDTKVVTI